MKSSKYFIVFMSIPFSTSAALSDTYLNGDDVQYRHDGLSAGIGAGYLGGHAKEFVYTEQGRLLSKLDWKTRSATVISGEINYDAYSWLSLNVKGWTTVGSGRGHLEDRDWQDATRNQNTDFSSSASDLNYANEYDVSIRLWGLNSENAKAGMLAGYQQSRYSWTAHGGRFDYAGTDDDDNYRPDLPRNVGNFPAKNIVGYSQTLSAPYIGAAGNYSYNDIELSAVFKYSPWANTKDYDNHYLNNTITRVNTIKGTMWSGMLQAGYYFTPVTKLYTEATYTVYSQNRGDIRGWNNGNYQFGRDMGGISNRNWTFTAGVRYAF